MEYKVKNKRLAKYLYSLGFNRTCVTDGKNEYWIFDYSNLLQESLIFYFQMREKNR